jgi:hypothetical protein
MFEHFYLFVVYSRIILFIRGNIFLIVSIRLNPLQQLLLINAQNCMRHQQLIFNHLTNIIAYAPSWTLLILANLLNKQWKCQCLYRPLVWAWFT